MAHRPPAPQLDRQHEHAPAAHRPGNVGDRAGLAANLLTIVLNVVSLVQAYRESPLWIVPGVLALAALVVYWYWRRRWMFAVLGLVVLLAVGGGGWLLALSRTDVTHPPAAAMSPTVAPTATGVTSPTVAVAGAAGPAAAVTPTASTPPLLFADVVRLDKKTGVDLDGGKAVTVYTQDATADLYLDWGYVLYSSVRHSAMYDDSNAGPEDGAYQRCRTYLLAQKQSAPSHFIGGGDQQYCFTTSDGHPGWVQAVNEVGDGGLLLKVDVWQS